MFADRTSMATIRANQLRLYCSVFAAILVNIVRQIGLRGTTRVDLRLPAIPPTAPNRMPRNGVPLSLRNAPPPS